MPLLTPGDSHIHHHGALAGASAGAVAVLVGGVFMLGVWHRVSGQVAVAVSVLVWALLAVFVAAALYVVAFLGLRVRHHVTHPETLTRHSIRAEVIPGKALPAEDVPAIPAPAPLAALPPADPRTRWHLPRDPDAAAAVLRAIAEGKRDGEGA